MCVPFGVAELHEMAARLAIKRHWFHGGRLPHYDIPVGRMATIGQFATRVSSREILRIIKGVYTTV